MKEVFRQCGAGAVEEVESVEKAGAGQVRIAVEISAVSAGPAASVLATETRVAAMDTASRRAFRAYWLAVGPFSALIRRRWLRAAERVLA